MIRLREVIPCGAKRAIAAAVAALILHAGQARAGVVLFSDFGPGETYDSAGGWPALDNGAVEGSIILEAASAFVPSVSDTLAGLLVAASSVSPAFPGIVLSVDLTSDAGDKPGAVLEAFSVDVGLRTRTGRESFSLPADGVGEVDGLLVDHEPFEGE